MAHTILVVGSLNLDLVASVPHFPQPGETLAGSAFTRHTGGKGANQAASAALAAAPGTKVQMIARHGTDGFAPELLQALQQAGVDTSAVLPEEGSTGVALITVTEAGENTIVLIPGANARLSPQHLLDERDRIAAAHLILTQLETPISTLEQLLTLTSELRIPILLDPAPAQLLGEAILHQVTWLTPNETEAAALLRTPVPDLTDLPAFAGRLLQLGPANILLKLGSRGAYLATREGRREHIPAHTVKAIDSTAAGDALNGAMAAALAEGADPVEAARFGVAAAALSVTRPGAIPSLPTRLEIEAFLIRSRSTRAPFIAPFAMSGT
jgi:ribokinase